jgi:hypothetical protein
MEDRSPENIAKMQLERVDVLVNQMLEWLSETGEKIDVDNIKTHLDDIYTNHVSKLQRGKPLDKSELRQLNSIYSKYTS